MSAPVIDLAFERASRDRPPDATITLEVWHVGNCDEGADLAFVDELTCAAGIDMFVAREWTTSAMAAHLRKAGYLVTPILPTSEADEAIVDALCRREPAPSVPL